MCIRMFTCMFPPGLLLLADFLMVFHNHLSPKIITEFSRRGSTVATRRERAMGSLGIPRYPEEGSLDSWFDFPEREQLIHLTLLVWGTGGNWRLLLQAPKP